MNLRSSLIAVCLAVALVFALTSLAIAHDAKDGTSRVAFAQHSITDASTPGIATLSPAITMLTPGGSEVLIVVAIADQPAFAKSEPTEAKTLNTENPPLLCYSPASIRTLIGKALAKC